MSVSVLNDPKRILPQSSHGHASADNAVEKDHWTPIKFWNACGKNYAEFAKKKKKLLVVKNML